VLLLTIMHTEATPTPIIPNVTLNFLSKFFFISTPVSFFFLRVNGHVLVVRRTARLAWNDRPVRATMSRAKKYSTFGGLLFLFLYDRYELASSAVPAFCERRKIYRMRRKIYPLPQTSGE
jgi:hypothetical protein